MSADMRQSSETVVVLGKIVGAYGIKGWVRLHPFADDPLSWRKISRWLHKAENESSAQWQPIALKQLRLHSDGLIASFDGVDDRTAAETLVGHLVGALREAMPETAEDEFYWGDLVGLDVRNVQSQCLGTVRELMETGANTVLVVVDAEGGERLIPFVSTVIEKVDLARREILVDWGLDW